MLIQKKKWDDAIEFSNNNIESLDLVLELFLAHQAPIEYVEKIIALGSSFNDHAVFDLILLKKTIKL